jgi:ABC-type sulfate/molybdate transport systems ATPase subunit
MLRVDELSARFGKRIVLDGVTFSASPGEIVAVLGPNGGGKSTLLRLLAGLAAPTSGSIAWGDVKLSQGDRVLVPPSRRGVGLLLQEGVLFPHLRVRENVALGLDPTAPGGPESPRVSEALEAVQLGHLGSARVQRLSGGEAQRVALARALVQSPVLMLLDEPFHSLDTAVKRSILGQIRSLVTERGLCAMLVTHDADEASALADRILLLRHGKKLQEGTLDELYRAPADPWAARLLGDVASLDTAEATATGIALPPGFDARTAWFRPEAVNVALAEGEHALAVASVRRSGAFTDVAMSLPSGRTLSSRRMGECSLAVGSRVEARILWTLPARLEGEPRT